MAGPEHAGQKISKRKQERTFMFSISQSELSACGVKMHEPDTRPQKELTSCEHDIPHACC
jgi:hypothetical protein